MSTVKGNSYFTWINAGSAANAVLLCVHGLSLHGRAFKVFGERMSKLGIATYACDLRGFGRFLDSPGGRLNFPQCLKDLHDAVKHIRERHPGLRLFMLGESLGGAVAVSAVARNPQLVDGLILSAPARVVNDHKMEALQVAYKAVANCGKPVCISESVFRYTPDVVAWRETDPLIRLEYSVGELLHLTLFLFNSYQAVTKLPEIPVLVVQGHADQLIRSTGTLQFFDRIPSRDKQMVILGEEGHLIFQTPTISHKTITLIRDWISDRGESLLTLPDSEHLKRAS